jgi:hypothetical protein
MSHKMKHKAQSTLRLHGSHAPVLQEIVRPFRGYSAEQSAHPLRHNTYETYTNIRSRAIIR